MIKKKFDIKFLLLIVFVLGLIYCGKKDSLKDTSEKTGIEKSKKSPPISAQAKKEEAVVESGTKIIKKVFFTSKILRSDSNIQLNVETFSKKSEDQSLSYVFWKNGKKFLEQGENKLPPFTYKKNDLMFAEVHVYDNSDQLIEKKRTDMIVIANSPPVIKEITIPDIKGYGIYEFEVSAEDCDGDQLTYKIEGKGLPAGLSINQQSGKISFQFNEPPPEVLKFTVVAVDESKGLGKKEVTLKFKKQPNK